MARAVLGLTEKVKIQGYNGAKIITARIDTGATKSSVDSYLASELQLGPIVETRLIRSAHGHTIRPVVHGKIEIEGQKLTASFTIADRKHMKYKMLIGQNILKLGKFIIDPLHKVDP